MKFIRYRIGARHYRQGVLYEVGDIVTVEESEKPHPSWVKVEYAPEAPTETTDADSKKKQGTGSRAADTQI